jgi:hypothetical protein
MAATYDGEINAITILAFRCHAEEMAGRHPNVQRRIGFSTAVGFPSATGQT